MLRSFSEMPCFTHIHLLAFTPLGAKVSPLLLSEHFYLTSRVLIALRRVTSMKVTCWLGLLLSLHVPSSGI